MGAYNNVYFQRILKLAKEYRLEQAIYEFQKYLHDYPKDVEGYIFYADTLIKANRLEEAESVLGNVEMTMTSKTSDKTKENYILVKAKLLCQQEKYEKCYLFFNQYESILSKIRGIGQILLFLRKKLGTLKEGDFKQSIYTRRQIISYSEQEALLKIEGYKDESRNSFFQRNLNLIEIYNKLRGILPLENKVTKGFLNDAYVFKYNANGYVERKLADYIEVITLQDSNDIITMYPYENMERRCYTDLTPSIEENAQLKRARSQIDKFNQRYGKNK